jgi:hypothetical protein
VAEEAESAVRRHALRRPQQFPRVPRQHRHHRLPAQRLLQPPGQKVALQQEQLLACQSLQLARPAPPPAAPLPAARTSAEVLMTHFSARKIRQPELRARAILKSATIRAS